MKQKRRLRNLRTWKFWKRKLLSVPAQLESLTQWLQPCQKASSLERKVQKEPQDVPDALLTNAGYTKASSYTRDTFSYSIEYRPSGNAYTLHDLVPQGIDTKDVNTNVYLKKITENTEPVRIFRRRWEAPKDDFIEDIRERLPESVKHAEQGMYDMRGEQLKLSARKYKR